MRRADIETSYCPAMDVWVNKMGGTSIPLGAYHREAEAVDIARQFALFHSRLASDRRMVEHTIRDQTGAIAYRETYPLRESDREAR